MGIVPQASWIQWISAGRQSMNPTSQTYRDLIIFRIMATNTGRISVKQIHESIQPQVGMSKRSLQRHLNNLEKCGLVSKDGEMPQGFTLSKHAKKLFNELATGIDE